MMAMNRQNGAFFLFMWFVIGSITGTIPQAAAQISSQIDEWEPKFLDACTPVAARSPNLSEAEARPYCQCLANAHRNFLIQRAEPEQIDVKKYLGTILEFYQSPESARSRTDEFALNLLELDLELSEKCQSGEVTDPSEK